jgi:hypothetical protein
MAGHGSRARYKAGCRCLACSRNRYRSADRPSDLRWSIRYLAQRHDRELIQDHIDKYLSDPQPLNFYKENGLTDFDADKLAVSLGEHPMLVWPGWIEAGDDGTGYESKDQG